ncbi:MAG: hypothetical protein PVG53_13930 [Holophagae bacterium]|jgi:hypothetical protein
MKRFSSIGVVLAAALVLGSCGGNSTLDDTEAAVYVTVEIEEYNPDIDICSYIAGGTDVTIETMNVVSNPKDPGASLPSAQDVRITRWVITPERNDGGTTASPQAIFDQGILVPAGGETSLDNWRVYPVEYLDESPLNNLLPQNGGFDPETGARNVRQRFVLQMFGETISGKSVASIPQSIQFNFFCGSP